MSRILTGLFSVNSLVTNFVFSIVLTYAIWILLNIGTFGIAVVPMFLIFLQWFIQYCFDAGRAAVNGADQPPIHKFKSFDFRPFIFILLNYSLYVLLTLYLDIEIALIAIGLLFPAILCSFLVEDQLLSALNPVHLVRYIVLLKANYFILSLILVVSSLFGYLIPNTLWLWPKIFLYQTVLVASFFATGQFIHQHRIALDIQTPETKDEQEIRTSSEQSTIEFNKQSDRWHRLSEVHKYDEALEELLQYLQQTTDQVETALNIMDELLVWRKANMSVKFLPYYIKTLMDAKKSAKAFSIYQSLTKRVGFIQLDDEYLRLKMQEIAKQVNDHELVDYLSNRSID